MRAKAYFETATNVLCAFAALTIITLGIHIYRHPVSGMPTRPSEVSATGKILSPSSASWSSSDHTLVLAISTHCHFCTDSLPFFRKAVLKAQADNFQVVVFAPESGPEISSYLEVNGLGGVKFAQSPLNAIYVHGTPTVLVVSRSGAVEHSWIGKSSEGKQEEILQSL